MKTRSLDLEEALPKGDKFNFAGRLDASINCHREQLTANAQQRISQVDDFMVNTVEMGDFDFLWEGVRN